MSENVLHFQKQNIQTYHELKNLTFFKGFQIAQKESNKF